MRLVVNGDGIMAYTGTKRKVFISYHQADQKEVQEFIDKWSVKEGVFIPKALGVYDDEELINSTNPDYVMSQIRKKYLGDSTVTIVLLGKCTHSRRYIDWEIKTSLRQGEYTPNGLLGIILPSKGSSAHLPERFDANWTKGHIDCYARFYTHPTTVNGLANMIEDAFKARTERAHLIKNTSDMLKYNRKCKVCGITH